MEVFVSAKQGMLTQATNSIAMILFKMAPNLSDYVYAVFLQFTLHIQLDGSGE
jgi:hypothetical protein